jgi:long-chain acyl-CoA synthetase
MNLGTIIERHPDGDTALISSGEVTSYGALRQQCAAIRGGLIGAGVVPGDRVALLLSSTWYFAVAHLGALGAGAVVVPLNPMSPTAELQRQLDAVAPKVVIVGPSAARAFEGVDRVSAGISHVFTPEGVELANGCVPFEDLFVSSPAPIVDRAQADLAVLMFTSGTAGAPRAAMLTHGNLQANLQQMQSQPGGALTASDVLLCVIPLHHIYGLNATLHFALSAGASTLLVQRFDPVASAESIQRHGVTVVAGVPPMYDAWASLPPEAAPRDAFATVRLLASGASRLDPLVARQFAERFGKEIGEGYGLTEASPTVTAAAFPMPRTGTIGLPLPGVEVRVVDTNGDDVVVGDPGEIWVRGPNVFSGYWNDKQATDTALDGSGWLHTGDVAVVDQSGHLTLVDRAKDLIIVSGFNVYPAEVEEALVAHPGIREAAVIGVPHPHTGETVSAFVVPEPDRMLDEDEVIEFCSTQLARYKCPSKVTVVTELPRQATGKLLRRNLL